MGDQTPGFIIVVLIASAVLTLPAAAVLLWLYRRSVRRGMTTGASHPESPLPSVSAATPHPPIRIIDRAADPPAYAERSLRAAVTIYAAAGLAFALLFAIGWGMQSEGAAWTWLHLLAFAMALAVVYFWPAILAIELVAATSRRQRLSIALGYFIALALIGAGALAVSSKVTTGQLATLWLPLFAPASLPPSRADAASPARLRSRRPQRARLRCLRQALAQAGQHLHDRRTRPGNGRHRAA
jgi:hypothetical protein